MLTNNTLWTTELVEECICVASQVERMLPPSDMKNSRWIIIRAWQALWWDELDDGITNADFIVTDEHRKIWEMVVLHWLPMIDSNKDLKILWWRACGLGWSKIGRRLGLERHTIANRHLRATRELVKALNRKKI